MSVARSHFWLYGIVLFPLLAWCALPGRFAVWPLLFICLVPLFFCLADAANTKNAFLRGLIAGLVFYILQLYWIISVLSTYGGLPKILSTLSLLLLVLYMSLYLGIFASCFYLLVFLIFSKFYILAYV